MSKIKVFIIGRRGRLAKNLLSTLKKNEFIVRSASHEKINYSENFHILKKKLDNFKPKVVINCYAITKHKESIKNIKKTFFSNSIFPYLLSDYSEENKITFIQISSEAVFSSKYERINAVKDKTNPETVLGLSKLAAEKLIISNQNTIILRLPFLYGEGTIINNLISRLKMKKKIKAADDVYSTLISTQSVSDYITSNLKKNNLSKLKKIKIIHLSNDKLESIYQFIYKIAAKSRLENYVIPYSEKKIFRKHKKPQYLGLKCNVNFKC